MDDLTGYYKGRDKSIEYYELLLKIVLILSEYMWVMTILEGSLMYLHGPTVDRTVATNRI